MRLVRILFWFLLWFAYGCSSAWHADPQFTAEQRAAIQAAADEWATVTHGEATFDFVWDDPDFTHAKNNIYITLNNVNGIDDWQLRTAVLDPGAGFIHQHINLDPTFADSNLDLFRVAALHELGHSLGMKHVGNELATMSPNASIVRYESGEIVMNGPGCITLPDLAEYYRATRGSQPRPNLAPTCVLP